MAWTSPQVESVIGLWFPNLRKSSYPIFIFIDAKLQNTLCSCLGLNLVM